MKNKYRKILSLCVIFLTIAIPSLLSGKIYTAQGINSEPFFKIYLFVPNTANPSPIYLQFEENLPKIGIEIETIFAGWSQISPRTWGYQGPYPIPSYNESGYDMLSIGWNWDIEYNPTGLYETFAIVPDGDNYYQYSNLEMDLAIANYASAFNDTDKVELVDTIQKLLYEDLPTLGLYHSMNIFPYKEGFTGWDGVLWSSKSQPMENWSIPGQNDFVYATPANFETFHPYQYQSDFDKQWLNQIYNGLIQRQPGNHFWGDRITSSYTSSDYMNWTIKINPDALWGDGTPITADDVIYSYQLAVNPESGFESYSLYSSWWNNDSFTKINDKELRINFTSRDIFQERNLALQLLPKHIWSGIAPENHSIQASEWMTTNPEKIFGAGPYRLTEFNATADYILLERNPFFDDWTGNTPNFDTIKFQFFSSKVAALEQLSLGAVDLVDANFYPQMEEIAFAGINYSLVKDSSVQEVGINMNHPYLGTGILCPIAGVESAKYIRYAISHCVDRQYHIENKLLYGAGTPAATSVPNVAIGFNESYVPFSFNISKAREYMSLAGFEFNDGNNSYVIGISPVITCILLVSVFIIHNKRKKISNLGKF